MNSGNLYYLVQAIKSNKNIIPTFQSYYGTDWKSFISYYNHSFTPKSIVLYKSDTTKLILTGWNEYQYQLFPKQNATIHTLVMEGNLYSRTNDTISIIKKQMILPRDYMYIAPYSTLELLCTKKCASLHLIQL
jgi:hypothetical protein